MNSSGRIIAIGKLKCLDSAVVVYFCSPGYAVIICPLYTYILTEPPPPPELTEYCSLERLAAN